MVRPARWTVQNSSDSTTGGVAANDPGDSANAGKVRLGSVTETLVAPIATGRPPGSASTTASSTSGSGAATQRKAPRVALSVTPAGATTSTGSGSSTQTSGAGMRARSAGGAI